MKQTHTSIVDVKYYDIRKRLAKYKNYKMLFLMGDRNVGKTTSVYRQLFNMKMDEYIRTKEQPKTQIGIIMRTSKSWDRIKGSYLENIKDLLNFNFMVEGSKIYAMKDIQKMNKDGSITIKQKRLFTLAQIFILWNSNDYKSGNYEYIDYLVFDETIPEDDATYIPNEINRFESLYSTINRGKGKVKFIGICNRVNNSSIYFTNYLNVGPDTFPRPGDTILLPHRLVVLEYALMSEFVRDKLEKSREGQVFKNSKYQRMAMGQDFLHDESSMIKTKLTCPYYSKFNIAIGEKIWIVSEFKRFHMWIVEGKDQSVKTYCLDYLAAIKNNQALNWAQPDNLIYMFRQKISRNILWFKEVETREEFIDWLKRTQRV